METTRSKAAIIPLAAVSCAIILLGAAFAVYSLVSGTNFRVLGADIPGALFAAVAVYLGIRYLISTMGMAKKIHGKNFSWKNFGGTK